MVVAGMSTVGVHTHEGGIQYTAGGVAAMTPRGRTKYCAQNK